MANTLSKDRIVGNDPGQAAVPAQAYRAPTPAWTQTITTTTTVNVPGETIPPGTLSVLTFDTSQKTNPDGSLVVGWNGTYTTLNTPGQTIPGQSYQQTTTQIIYHPADPGQPYVQGVAYRPPSTTVSFNLGWNAGARSLSSIHAGQPGGYEFKIGLTVVGAVVGLNPLDTSRDYSDIAHGIYFERGTFKVMQLGVEVPGTDGTYLASDVFSVQRDAFGNVSYTQNGSVVYTSLTASTGEVFLDTSLFSANDFVDAPKLIEARSYGVSNAAMQPLIGFSTDTATYGRAYASMRPLVTITAGEYANRARAFMRPLTGLASDSPYGASSTVMQPLTSSSTGKSLRIPEFSIADTAMMALHAGFSYGSAPYVPSTSMNYMRPVVGMASDAPYSKSSASMFPMIGWASEKPPEVQNLRIPTPTLIASGSASNSSMVGAIPAPTLVALGGATAARGLRFPRPTLVALGGATAAPNLRLPRPTLVASGTVENVGQFSGKIPALKLTATAIVGTVGNARLQLPEFTLQASAITGTVGNAALIAPDWTLAAYAGAVLSVDVSRQLTPTLKASAITGTVGKAVLTLPLMTLTASGTNSEGGRANLLIPAPTMVQGAVAYLIAPGFTLTAIGQATVALAYEAYAVNLQHASEGQPDQATRYTRFAFDCIVRYQGSYFGMNAQGLFLLEGPTDYALPTPLPIPAAVRTGITDFKSSEKKTLVSAYFAGRMGPDATVTLYAGETGEEAYAFATPRGEAIQNHRQKLGRGVKNRYFALGVATAGALELDGLELLVEKLTRRI